MSACRSGFDRQILDSSLNLGHFQLMKDGKQPHSRQNPKINLPEAPKTKSAIIRPPNYFTGAYSRTENRVSNHLSKASMIHAPKDLE